MMSDIKIGIVGSSKAQDSISVPVIVEIMKKYPEDTVFVSGGANGIDCGVRVACEILERELIEHLPKTEDWKEYKKRNELIADECDKIYSIALPKTSIACYHCGRGDHEKTAGCWTGKKNGNYEVVILE